MRGSPRSTAPAASSLTRRRGGRRPGEVDQGRPDADSVVFVGVLRYDLCTQQLISLASGLIEPSDGALQIDRFNTATVGAEVEMRNLRDGSTSTMLLQLQWTGTDDRERAREHMIIDYPGFHLNAWFKGRPAPRTSPASSPTARSTTPPALPVSAASPW